MFGFLKDKLKKWTEKISSEKVGEEEKVKSVKKSKKESKVSSSKKIKTGIKKIKTKKKSKKEIQVEELEKEVEEIKELSFEEDSLDKEIEEISKVSKEIEEDILYSEDKTKKKKGFFSRLISSNVVFTKEDFELHKEDLEMILLENNVALEVVDKILLELQEKLVGKEISKKEFDKEIMDSFRESISKILIEPFDVLEKIRKKDGVFVILFCGINGTGKTTTIAKLSSMLNKNKISSVLAAGDTFRAASIEQLKLHGEKVGVKVISGNYGSDPASVGFEAINYAKKNNIKVVLIDSAGRMHTAKNLMSEIEKIARVCKPDLKIFVGESIAGNDILEQIKSFNEAISLDGIVLAKADIDEKGGSAISVGFVTGKPILFLGVGQEYKDLEIFDKEKFLNKLFQ
jgi:fused signal recognition particle receptor